MVTNFILLSRNLRNWCWYRNSNMVHLLLHLLFEAQYQDGIYMGVELKRGQLITGRKKLSDETGLSEREIRTCLKRLANDQQIVQQTTNKYSIITICNYDSWIVSEIKNDQQTTNKTNESRPTNDHNNNKDNKEINSKEEDTNVSKKKTISYPAEYESDYALYERKGSKKNGYERWKHLTDEDKQKMRRHIPYYLQSNDRQFLKDFEGYINQRLFESPVYRQSTLLYDPQTFESQKTGEYDPSGFLNYDSIFRAWRCFGRSPLFDFYDGYDDIDRPDGARCVNQSTVYLWSSVDKKWRVA